MRLPPPIRFGLAGLLSTLLFAGCQPPNVTRICYGDGVCLEPDGQLVFEDGQPLCELDDTCETGNGGGDGDSGNGGTAGSGGGDGDGGAGGGDTDASLCQSCPVTATDSDGDCISDADEDANSNGSVDLWDDANDNNCVDEGEAHGESDPNNNDTDGDGILDGCEDRNRDGVHDPGELYAWATDTDCDGVSDGIEDRNKNGVYEPPFEGNPFNSDTDNDGLLDGQEDANGNGIVDEWIDLDGDGCFDPEDTPGETNPLNSDSDGDRILDQVEDNNLNGACDGDETCAWNPDSDCDLLEDGVEDANQNGVRNSTETDPLDNDSDNDGIPDGVEDADLNGSRNGQETDPRLPDSDGDNIRDGVEDANQNGQVDPFVDTNGNGCWDEGEAPGESNPRLADSDADGIPDRFEDRDQDGACRVTLAPDPANPGQNIRTLLETCAWLADSDCDGLTDGLEDVNRNGSFEQGELNPRSRDTDLDGLADGCFGGTTTGCEDLNNNGVHDIDNGETDPRRVDSDNDSLTDGCEVNFVGGRTNPNAVDTDGDGFSDAEEDGNRNCEFEPDVENCDDLGICRNETDPRVFDDPLPEGTEAYVQQQVCGTANLKDLTFAESNRRTHDYRQAFEVEESDADVACDPNNPSACGAGEECDNLICTKKARYLVTAFGRDNDNDGFSPDDSDDDLLGHIFQSPRGVVLDPGVTGPVNRDVYGFVLVQEQSGNLDDYLDTLRDQLRNSDNFADVTQISDLIARPAHDSLPSDLYPSGGNFRINYAQRVFQITMPAERAALVVRNSLLEDEMVTESIDPPTVPPASDPVYGAINDCGQNPNCYTEFTLYLSAVQRLDQQNVNGDDGVLVLTFALTPDNSADGSTQERLYNDRLVRLQDLTGGSALARTGADIGKACEKRDQQLAVADILWVVDDSKSMQQTIERLQQASRDARAVLTANSGIVDFRVALTTTNPSRTIGTQCPGNCTETCGDGSGTCGSSCDDTVGCLPVCPDNCDASCNDSGGSCSSSCVAPCTPVSDVENLITVDVFGGGDLGDGLRYLPGGGGTFYFEDSQYLDCNGGSASTTVESCSGNLGFEPFFDTGNRVRLSANAGFLGSASGECAKAFVDLTSAPAGGADSCASNPTNCCERLTEACGDGPTVLASQMCDLIRSMGGLPQGGSASARPHSAPEHGTRAARRLIEDMLPALPANYPTDCVSNCGLDPEKHLRLLCDAGPECQQCDPRDDDNCEVAPFVTIFLSDEEDFFFKDECNTSPQLTDRRQLPAQCNHRAGSIDDFESCDPCEQQVACETDPECAGIGLGSVCGDDGVCTCDRRSYCEGQGFLTGSPDGYDPDAVARESGKDFTIAFRDDDAAQCSTDVADVAVTCNPDPCADQGNEPDCNAITLDLGEGPLNYCSWTGSVCRTKCSTYTTGGTEADQLTACEADPICEWEQAFVNYPLLQNTFAACQPKYPLSDCRACKRFLRTLDAVEGVDTDDYTGTRLIGFEDLGPVYAIVRDRGVQGFGGYGFPEILSKPQDPCEGGAITWGLGDGQAYRSIAQETLGRTQDVCADSYANFMGTVISDIAALSSPYPLTGSPIAATIKVGIARLNGESTDYIEVSRSNTQGFFFSAPNNTLAFKSDPVDGACNDGDGCLANGVIEESEILFAQNADTVPREGDIIYISYRTWLPVPCLERCGDNQACQTVICSQEGDPPECVASDDECPLGYLCNVGAGICEIDCTPGELVDVCVDDLACGDCQVFDTDLGECTSVGGQCACNASNVQSCTPGVASSCPIGFTCDENCGCAKVPGCENGFNGAGDLAECQESLLCCERWDDSQELCEGAADESACNAQPDAVCTLLGLDNATTVCRDDGDTCSGDGQCPGDDNTCLTECQHQRPCEYGGGSCDFAYPTCCGGTEQAACFGDPETGEASLFCESTCECTPGCAFFEQCREIPGSGVCSCFGIGP